AHGIENDHLAFLVNNCQRHAIATAAGWITERHIVIAVLRHTLAHASSDASNYAVAIDEAFDIGSEFSKIFRARGRFVSLHRAVDNALRQARIEIAAGALANENIRIAFAPEVAAVDFPILTPSRIRAADDE